MLVYYLMLGIFVVGLVSLNGIYPKDKLDYLPITKEINKIYNG